MACFRNEYLFGLDPSRLALILSDPRPLLRGSAIASRLRVRTRGDEGRLQLEDQAKPRERLLILSRPHPSTALRLILRCARKGASKERRRGAQEERGGFRKDPLMGEGGERKASAWLSVEEIAICGSKQLAQ